MSVLKIPWLLLILILIAIPKIVFAKKVYEDPDGGKMVCYSTEENAKIATHLRRFNRLRREARALRSKVSKTKGKVCYSVEVNREIKRRLAELKGARKKIAARDRAIRELRKEVKGFVRRETKRKEKLKTLGRRIRDLERDNRRSANRLRTALTIGGVVVVAAIVAVVVVSVTNAVTSSSSSSSSRGSMATNPSPLVPSGRSSRSLPATPPYLLHVLQRSDRPRHRAFRQVIRF